MFELWKKSPFWSNFEPKFSNFWEKNDKFMKFWSKLKQSRGYCGFYINILQILNMLKIVKLPPKNWDLNFILFNSVVSFEKQKENWF